MSYWPVTWIDRRGEACLIDVEGEQRALAIAVSLNETGRKAVVLHSSYEIEPDAEVYERIKKRVLAATVGAGVNQVLREAAGGGQ